MSNYLVCLKLRFVMMLFSGVMCFIPASFAQDLGKNLRKDSFYDGKGQYRGFYWFERQKKRENQERKVQDSNENYVKPTPEEAERMIERGKKKLDAARNQMIAIGLDENAPKKAKIEAIIAYKKLEVPMWSAMVQMSEASDMANFLEPSLADEIENPTNVFGVKLKRKMEEKKREVKIHNFAAEFDLVLFASDSCIYCQEFKPVVRDFAGRYGFSLEVSDLKSKAGELALSLGIKAVPTLIVVKKDGSQAFELSRGMMSISGLEQNIVLALEYSEQLIEDRDHRKKTRISNAHRRR